MKTTPEKVRATAMTLDAMMEAFENAFFEVIDTEDCERRVREKASYAFYGIRSMLENLIVEMEDLSCHMMVCDAKEVIA